MADFYLPYHFVPAVRGGRKQDLSVAEFRKRDGGKIHGVRHDSYVKDTFSGTIHCEAEAVSAVFVGDNRDDDAEEVSAFKLSNKPALPGSSLRGMVSAIAEAASNSAARVLGRTVLGEPCYSYRKRMQEPLSAVGILRKEGDQFWIEPICLPLIQYDHRGYLQSDMQKWTTVFSAGPVFRVYVGDKDWIRRDKDDPSDITKKRWAMRTTSAATAKMPLRVLSWKDVEQLTPNAKASLNIKNNKTVVAQNRDASGAVQDGLLRVLGCYEKTASGEELRQIPGNKQHELFLPYVAGRFKLLPVPADVVERFQQLANQMTKQSEGEQSPRPFEPKDTRPGRKVGDRLIPIAGDLVFFDVSSDSKTVSEISYSSIWRGRVETISGGTAKGLNAWVFFRDIDKELVPFTSERLQITAAEQIFGFSEEKDGEEAKKGLRLRGRVRFSHGIGQGEIEELPITPLKELSSPKPPSPALYFRTKAGINAHIAKSELKLGSHWPQGRKFYLHHPTAIQGNSRPWENVGKFEGKRQVKIRPWAKGSKWRFEIRFDNLSGYELGLLFYALSPSEEFRHKIGMGKPIGLGSIHVKVSEVEFVDRQERYTAKGWGKPRSAAPVDGVGWEKFRDDYRDNMPREIRLAIEELGNPAKLNGQTEITYPRVIGQNDQTELYKWFVSNDDPKSGETASLRPIVLVQGKNVAGPKIQPLPRLPAPRGK